MRKPTRKPAGPKPAARPAAAPAPAPAPAPAATTAPPHASLAEVAAALPLMLAAPQWAAVHPGLSRIAFLLPAVPELARRQRVSIEEVWRRPADLMLPCLARVMEEAAKPEALQRALNAAVAGGEAVVKVLGDGR